MKPLALEEIIKFLKDNIEPLHDNVYGNGYRASVYLRDGTYLPCVLFRNASVVVDLAIKRLKEEQPIKSFFSQSKSRYKDIIKTFVANGNSVNYYDIAKIEKSFFALPTSIHNQIKGETAMSWTAFVVKFLDGRLLSFGTTWNWEFFEIPDSFNVEDAVEVINNSYLSKNGEIINHGSIQRNVSWNDLETIQKDRQFFICYIDHL